MTESNNDSRPPETTVPPETPGGDCVRCLVRPSKNSALNIEALYQSGDPPFIFAVSGKITISVMEQIEQDMIDNPEIFDRGDGEYLFTATYQEGQQSFPESGMWDFLPHWELELIHFLPNDTIHP